MTAFVLLALALTTLAAGVIVWPLVRQRQESHKPAIWAAFGAVAVLAIGGAGLYATLSQYSWRAPPAADSPQAMVGRLARRLERNPNDLNGWLMLGRSYAVLGEWPLSIRAYGRAHRLAKGRNVEALLGLAEALALSDEKELDGRAGQLLEQALQLDPRSSKALFYSGSAAARRGDLITARERFARLLALDPPANIRAILEEQIAAFDRQLGGAARER